MVEKFEDWCSNIGTAKEGEKCGTHNCDGKAHYYELPNFPHEKIEVTLKGRLDWLGGCAYPPPNVVCIMGRLVLDDETLERFEKGFEEIMFDFYLTVEEATKLLESIGEKLVLKREDKWGGQEWEEVHFDKLTLKGYYKMSHIGPDLEWVLTFMGEGVDFEPEYDYSC
jgi:hypothetical protein